jgi:hypothetical protein
MRRVGPILALAVLLAAGTAADSAAIEKRHATVDPAATRCNLYGYAPGSREQALCRVNVRFYRIAGPCGSSAFAALHRGYCHLDPPPFL